MGHAKLKDGRKLNRCMLVKVELVPGMTMAEFAYAEGNRGFVPSNPPIQDSQARSDAISKRALEIICRKPTSVKAIKKIINDTLPVTRRVLDKLRTCDLAHTVQGKRGVKLWVGGPAPHD